MRRSTTPPPDASARPVDRQSAAFDSGPRAVTIALAIGLWIAASGLLQAFTLGGVHPQRRIAIGVTFVAGLTAALSRRRVVAGALRRRPTLVLVVATAELTAATIDGATRGPYVVAPLGAVVLAVAIANVRIVWCCVALLDAGYAAAVIVERSPAALARSGELVRVLCVLTSYPLLAAALVGFAKLSQAYVAAAERELATGGAAPGPPDPSEPGDRHVAADGPGLLAGGTLTPRELGVIDGLASGLRPKEIAFAWGVSLATVRKHISHAKRKTGAQTLPELAAMRVTTRDRA
jgi:DNA-binding CsgD family transcriptional regulator